jgi:hypothetical protein
MLSYFVKCGLTYERFIAPPQKQVGFARSDIPPSIKNWICCPQAGLLHFPSWFLFCTAWASAHFWRYADSPFRRARCHSPDGPRVNRRLPGEA